MIIKNTQIWIFQKDKNHYSSSNIFLEPTPRIPDKVELWLHAFHKCSRLIAICVGTLQLSSNPTSHPKWHPLLELHLQPTHILALETTATCSILPIWGSISSLLYTSTKYENQANSKFMVSSKRDNMPKAGLKFGLLFLLIHLWELEQMVVINYFNCWGYQIEKTSEYLAFLLR